MHVEVLIPYRAGCEWRERSLDTVAGWWETICPDWPVRVVDDEGDPFSRGCSLNAGVEASDADVFVCADGDLLIGRSHVREAVELAQTPGLVQPFRRLDWYAEAATRRLWSAPWEAYDGTAQPIYSWGTDDVPLVGGINVLSRQTWEQAGGWLPGFRGWGHEDVAFEAQCSTLAGPTRRTGGVAAHLFHQPRTGGYRDAEGDNNDLAVKVMAAAGDPVAMREVTGATA